MNHKLIYALFGQFCLLATTEATPQPNIAHPVGSCYGGGLVFYINQGPKPPVGQHGLIVALEDAYDSYLSFDPSGKTQVLGTSSSHFSGQANTTNILNTVNDVPNAGDKSWPAAEAAAEYKTEDNCPTCSSWYLPSQDELASLYYQSTNYFGFWTNPRCSGKAPGPQLYWSSSQFSSSLAWYVDFNSGRVLYYPSIGPFNVRAIRAF